MNPYYWESGKPYLDEVTFNFATDDNSRMLALQSGAAPAVDGVPFSEVATLKADSSIYLQFTKVPYFEGLWLNHTKPHFADQNVRQAMQYAIDKAAINKTVYAGTGHSQQRLAAELRYDATPQQLPPYP